MPKPGGCHSFGISLGDAWDGPSGIRHGGGAKLNQALVRNVRTCCSDAKGEVSSGQNREDESTDAEHRDGAARSSDEGPVMGPERRGCVVQPSLWVNSSRQATGGARERSKAVRRPQTGSLGSL